MEIRYEKVALLMDEDLRANFNKIIRESIEETVRELLGDGIADCVIGHVEDTLEYSRKTVERFGLGGENVAMALAHFLTDAIEEFGCALADMDSVYHTTDN